MALRWGIVSAGKISNDFVNSLQLLPNSDHEVVAVAAKDLKRSEKFAKIHKIPNAYEGYEKIAKDKNVEIVYIGTINTEHFQVAMLMLDNGKHVLCEKPLCINEKQVLALISHAKTKNLFLMEAIWSRFFPAYDHFRETLASGVLGEIEEVKVNFGFNGWGTVDRVRMKSLGGGTLLDLGIYTIQFSQLIFKEQPLSISANGILNDEGVDLQMEAILTYSGNRKAIIKTSGIKHLDNIAYVKGAHGTIKVHDFWCPIRITDIDGLVKEFKLPAHKYNDFNFPNAAGLHYQAEEVRKCIRNGLIECPIVSHNESLIIARIEDEIRKEIGVKFPEDDEIY